MSARGRGSRRGRKKKQGLELPSTRKKQATSTVINYDITAERGRKA
jgi:hypothetical protein